MLVHKNDASSSKLEYQGTYLAGLGDLQSLIMRTLK